MRSSSLVVIPTYNEVGSIVPLARCVFEQEPSLEVLVVDDASPDGTGDLVELTGREEPRLHLLRRAGKLGLGTAYLAGFRWALDRGYARAITMDGDWSHHPRHLRGMIDAMGAHDLVIGSRYVDGGGVTNWGFHRRLLSAWANAYTRTVLRLRVRDCTSGYRCYSREVLNAVDPFSIRASGYSFLEEMVWRIDRAGFGIREIPIVFENRRSGASKIDSNEIWRAALHVLRTALRPPPVPRIGATVVRPAAEIGPPGR
jgi:dolichol-phosphate mannosyltransferase